jgi:hypothetical protein
MALQALNQHLSIKKTPPKKRGFSFAHSLFLCIIVAVQHNLKERTMFDFYKEFDKKWQDLAKQAKQVNDFWIDTIISSLKHFQK